MRCSICKEPLIKDGTRYICKNKHSFDIAKQGYVNLSRKQKDAGDNKMMVQARTHFLEKGYYAFLRDELKQIIDHYHPHVLLDIGCGQGYYTKEMRAPEKYGVDLSKEAILFAAKKDRSTQYIVDTIYDLPFMDESVDLVLSVFTPLPKEEIRRVLKKDGILVMVGPGKRHLFELKQLLYPRVLLNDDPLTDLEGFELLEQRTIEQRTEVDDVWDLFEMTPYRYRSPKAGMDRVRNASKMEIRFEFVISIWKKR